MKVLSFDSIEVRFTPGRGLGLFATRDFELGERLYTDKAYAVTGSPGCDTCGGSDIRREARRFVDACLNHGTTRVTIVGGSPKYHRQLRELVQHRVLKLRLVPGDARRSLRQARDDLRGSDLVIIWGATVLDHATSAPYTQQRELGRLHTVQQRGITSMLGAVVDHLSSSARPRGR